MDGSLLDEWLNMDSAKELQFRKEDTCLVIFRSLALLATESTGSRANISSACGRVARNANN